MTRQFRFLELLKHMPIGFVAASLGAATLSNAYSLLGFHMSRHIFMIFLGGALILFTIRLVLLFSVALADFEKPTVAGIYSTYFMGMMLFASWLKAFSPFTAKIVLSIAIVGFFGLMIVFTALHIFRLFSWEAFTPVYYVPFIGVLVTTVCAPDLVPHWFSLVLITFGALCYFASLPFFIYRLIKHPFPKPFVHTKTIFIAPVSLIVCSLINFSFPLWTIATLYIILLLSLGYVLLHIVDFFAHPFAPGFAALTFPMAIACFASLRCATFFIEEGAIGWSNLAHDVAGIQLFIASAFIGLVLYRFLHLIIAAAHVEH